MGYARMNPADKGANITVTSDYYVSIGGSTWQSVRADTAITSGKWYWEIEVADSTSSSNYIMLGVGYAAASLTTYPGGANTSWGMGNYNYFYNGATNYTYGETYINASLQHGLEYLYHTVGIALDFDNKKLWFSVNGRWQATGNPYIGANSATDLSSYKLDGSTPIYPMVGMYPGGSVNPRVKVNFGQWAFKHTPPTGFNAGVYSGSIKPTSSLTTAVYQADQLLSLSTSSTVSGTPTIYYKDDGTSFLTTSTSFTDNSSNNFTISQYGQTRHSTATSKFGGSSVYFDGVGDYLLIPNNAALNNFGTGDFTIAAWVYTKNNALTSSTILSCNTAWTSAVAYNFRMVATGQMNFAAGNSIPMSLNSSPNALLSNTWTHVAVTRASNITQLFVNGTSVATHSGTVTISNSSQPSIGKFAGGAEYWAGYIDEVIICKGAALWSSNFTPPTSRYTPDANTSLYLCSNIISGTEYVSPITISGTKYIEAIAVLPGYGSSAVTSGTYTIDKTFNASDWYGALSYTIDHTKIGTSLTDFPVKLPLGSSVGQTSYNTDHVFSYLTDTSSGTLDSYTRFYSSGTFEPLGLASGTTSSGVTISATTTLSGIGESYYFSGDPLNKFYVPFSTNFDFPGDFTIDGWVYLKNSDSNYRVLFSRSWSGNKFIYIAVSNTYLAVWLNNTNLASPSTGFSITISLNTWFHFAVVRSGSGSNNVSVYINGVSVASTTDTTDLTNADATSIGIGNVTYTTDTSSNKELYLTRLKVTKGEALWTSNFTPSYNYCTTTSGSVLMYNGNPINSANTSHSIKFFNEMQVTTSGKGKFNNGWYFDGVNDYIEIQDNLSDFDFQAGDFTIDWWDYAISPAASAYLFIRDSVASYSPFLYLGSSGRRKFYASTGGSWDVANNIDGGVLTNNVWSHIAIVRSGSTWYLFQDGSIQYIFSSSATLPSSSQPFRLGRGTTSYWSGYISDFRVSKGIARWTSNFTPPTRTYDDPSQYTDNKLKLAVTTTTVSGVETQLPVEVVYWDCINKKADLWTKVPHVNKDLDTIVKLYYSKVKTHNTNFIGATNTAQSIPVWSNEYNAVYHCGQFTTHDHHNNFLDSSGCPTEQYHPTTVGDMVLSDVEEYKSINLNGAAKYINMLTNPPLTTVSGDWTIVSRIRPNTTLSGGQGFIVFDGYGVVQSNGYWSVLGVDDVKKNGALISGTNYSIITATRSGTNYSIYVDGIDVSMAPITDTGWGLNSRTSPFRRIGEGKSGMRPAANFDEVFILSTAQSANWVSSMYHNINNTLVTVTSGIVPDPRAIVFSGYVQLDTYPVQRTVNLYLRSTGELINTAQSDPVTGYFEVSSIYAEPHYAVILHLLDDEFNLLGYDKIYEVV